MEVVRKSHEQEFLAGCGFTILNILARFFRYLVFSESFLYDINMSGKQGDCGNGKKKLVVSDAAILRQVKDARNGEKKTFGEGFATADNKQVFVYVKRFLILWRAKHME